MWLRDESGDGESRRAVTCDIRHGLYGAVNSAEQHAAVSFQITVNHCRSLYDNILVHYSSVGACNFGTRCNMLLYVHDLARKYDYGRKTGDDDDDDSYAYGLSLIHI